MEQIKNFLRDLVRRGKDAKTFLNIAPEEGRECERTCSSVNHLGAFEMFSDLKTTFNRSVKPQA